MSGTGGASATWVAQDASSSAPSTTAKFAGAFRPIRKFCQDVFENQDAKSFTLPCQEARPRLAISPIPKGAPNPSLSYKAGGARLGRSEVNYH
jgi:hypothetical protein